MPDFTLRAASAADVAEIMRLIRALAEYEKLGHEVVATTDDLHAALFGPTPQVHATVVEVGGAVIGFALWFYTYNTFAGRRGIWVEDVFVEPGHRGSGIGRALFSAIARRALVDGCNRLEWSVLDSNEPAIRFYRSIGAVAKDEWTTQRVSGDALTRLAAAGASDA